MFTAENQGSNVTAAASYKISDIPERPQWFWGSVRTGEMVEGKRKQKSIKATYFRAFLWIKCFD